MSHSASLEPDGTMIFTPATVVPTHLVRLLDRPDLLADFRHADEHPEEAVTPTLPDGPDLDSESPD
jgi:hypothetical protein